MMSSTDLRLKELGQAKYREYKLWFDQRLENAIKAAQTNKELDINQSNSGKYINKKLQFISLNSTNQCIIDVIVIARWTCYFHDFSMLAIINVFSLRNVSFKNIIA